MQLYNRESFEGDSIVNLYYFCIFISENQMQPNLLEINLFLLSFFASFYLMYALICLFSNK